ncbi:MAG: hypothetical protein AAGK21_13800 [Bacteroidota bacterium]
MSLRSIILCALLIVVIGANASAQTSVRLEAVYREPADTFEILDNVSNWWPGYNEAPYREYWSDSFGISPADSVLFARYAQLRERYFDKTGQQNDDPGTSRSGLFTDRAALNADPVGFSFYASESMDEAFDRLDQIVEPDEIAFLRSFYDHFASLTGPLTAETERLVSASLASTQRTLRAPELATYLGEVGAFFGVSADVTFTALYVWWPDAEQIMANPNGPFLLLRIRPFEGEVVNSADIVAHEAVHVVSAMQSDAQKRAVSDTMLEACSGALDFTGRLDVIEEPLATVLGNVEVQRRFDPGRFRWSRDWYGTPWVNLSARVLYPVVLDALAAGETIAGSFSAEAASLCATVVDAMATRRD